MVGYYKQSVSGGAISTRDFVVVSVLASTFTGVNYNMATEVLIINSDGRSVFYLFGAGSLALGFLSPSSGDLLSCLCS